MSTSENDQVKDEYLFCRILTQFESQPALLFKVQVS